MSRAHWLLIALAGCADTTPRWQLANDRILAIRTTPAELAPGARGEIEVLASTLDGVPALVAPAAVIAAATTPPALAGIFAATATGWTVTAPDAGVLASVRTALALDPGARIPVDAVIEVELAGERRTAWKRIWLGAHRDDPSLGDVTAGGVPIEPGLTVDGAEVALSVVAAPTDEVRWLTSVGELERDDRSDALLRVDAAATGTLALVVRDELGGVAWAFWSISVTR